MTSLEALALEVHGCTRCPLSAGRTQTVFGRGNPDTDLVFIGEAPGAEEDRQGFPFVGRSGQLLDRLVLEELGRARDDWYVMNTVKCRPPGNRDPLPAEIEACSPHFDRQLELLAPRVVVTLGNFATKLILRTSDGIKKVRGRTYPWRDGIVVVPTYHPAAVLRGGGQTMAEMRADLVRAKLALAGATAAP